MARRANTSDRFQYERECVLKGWTRIVGVDEAGRGPLAGPVVAAAVVFPSALFEAGIHAELEGLNDSKKLSAAKREEFYSVLTGTPEIQYSIVAIEARVIDEINILQATHRAMNEALSKLKPPPGHVLVDGLRVASLPFQQTALVKGDSLSYSIAAASVLAKVTRDRMMVEFDARFPAYGFAEHKGYGTPRHLAAIYEHGPCPIHRRSFAPLKPVQPGLFDAAIRDPGGRQA